MPLVSLEHDRVLYLRSPEPIDCRDVRELAWQLLDICQGVQEHDAGLVAVTLVGGSGSFFIRAPGGPADCDAASGPWADAIHAILELNTPTVACVEGDAIGPAWELALACDLRLVSSSAHVGNPEIQWSRMPAGGATQLLTRLCGQARALQLLLLGQILEGHQLPPIGLAFESPPADRLEPALEDLLGTLRASGPVALSYAREAVRSAVDLHLQDGLRLEADLAALLQTTSDRMTGINGFLHRRPVEFEGR